MDNETDEAWLWRISLEEVRDAHAALGEAEYTGADAATIAALGKAALRAVSVAAPLAASDRGRTLVLRNYMASIRDIAARVRAAQAVA